MTGKMAVVFGGSGFVGRHVVRELAKQGWRVRVGVRRPHLAQFLRPMGSVGQVQLAQTNIRDEQSILRALEGADAVINLVGILYQEGAQKFHNVQAEGAANIAKACHQVGISRVVHMSAIGAQEDSDSLYAQSKAEGEKAFLEAIPTTTILRPSIIFGPEDNFFNRFATMARFSFALPLIGGGKTRFQPVYVDDVADAVCACLQDPATAGRVYELGGPRIYSFKALMELMLDVTRTRRLLLPLPFVVASMIGFFGQLIGRLPFIEPLLTQDQVKLLKKDNVVSSSEHIQHITDLGIVPQTVESILPSYMVRYRKYGQFSEEQVQQVTQFND